MKYKATKRPEIKTFNLPEICGTDCNRLYGSENSFLRAENVLCRDGKIKTRPAFCADMGTAMQTSAAAALPFTLTDTVFYNDGKKCKIAYKSDLPQDGEAEQIKVYLVYGKSGIRQIGGINAMKDAEDAAKAYSRFKQVFFLVAEPTFGSGIYAFVTGVGDNGNVYDIRELSADLTAWRYIGRDECYSPIIYANGRGLFYNKVEAAGIDMDIGTPYSPEAPDLLSGAFTMCFTTDGYSSVFEMPVTNIRADAPVRVRIYSSVNTWTDVTVPVGDNKASDAENKYRVVCYRNKGHLYVFDSTDPDNKKPVSHNFDYGRNNLIVSSVLEASGREEIIGSKGAAVFGSHAYFYGNSEKPNEVYSCRISNPLYFPSASKTEIGSVDQPVVAAAHQNGKLVAFKQSEIYKINLAAGNTVSRAISENYDKDTFIIGDSLSSESISMKIGTTFGKTVAECAGQLIWLGSDGNVYTLEATTYGSEKNIFELSYPISSEIKKALAENATGKEPFAVSTGGYYYLFINDAVFVCDCRINNFGYAKRYAAENIGSAGWYIWKTPSLNITGAQICEEPVFCGKTDGNIDYLSSLSESVADTIPETDENGAVAEKRLPVKSSFTTAFYKFGTDGYKIPESIYFYSTGGILNAGCKTDKREYKKHIHNGKGEIILLPRSALGRVKRAAFFAESSSGMEISDIRFKYRTE